jgi:hypothetical protein
MHNPIVQSGYSLFECIEMRLMAFICRIFGFRLTLLDHPRIVGCLGLVALISPGTRRYTLKASSFRSGRIAGPVETFEVTAEQRKGLEL